MSTNRGPDVRALVIGAGPAGLAAAYELSRRNVAVRIIDRGDEVAASWRARHEQLRLNTHRSVSHQPGMRIPKQLGAFPSRDDYIDYLETYAGFVGVPVELNTRARRIDRVDSRIWRVATDEGTIQARHVVIATGSDAVPVVPEWPGRGRFRGRLLHAADFRHARDYEGKSVLIVGAGNSGVDVCNHLATVDIGPSWVSIRNGPNIAPQYLMGLPAQLIVAWMRWLPVRLQDLGIAAASRLALGDLTRLGVPAASKGAIARQEEDGVVLAVDDGFVAALKAGRFEVVPEIESMTARAVILKGGRRINPDVVICATGYELGLEDLVDHLNVLDSRGRPRVTAERRSSTCPGLWFLGQNSSVYGNMNIRRREVRRLAASIAADVAASRFP